MSKITEQKDVVVSELAVANDTISNLTSRLEMTRARVEELETNSTISTTQTVRGSMVVQPTCLADTLISDVKNVLYFKELSQIPYVNTFVKYIADYIKTRKVAGKRLICKLVIFDFCGTSKMYAPIPLVTGDEYMQRRVEMAGSRMEIAVSTPQMAVLSDLLTGKYGGADTSPNVLIVYDRTRQRDDIVRGKSVTKFYVCQSRESFERLREDYKIKENAHIITRSDVYFSDNQLDIPRVKNYAEFESESRKKRAYENLRTRYGGRLLMQSVLEMAKIAVQ